MFFLVPRIGLLLFVCFGLLGAWRAFRQRHSQWRPGRSRGGPFSPLPLLPAEVMRGADRTWVVFSSPQCPGVAEKLRAAEPASQVTEVDARREPRLAEAYRVHELPAVLLANRYGEVEARLVGRAAVEAALG